MSEVSRQYYQNHRGQPASDVHGRILEVGDYVNPRDICSVVFRVSQVGNIETAGHAAGFSFVSTDLFGTGGANGTPAGDHCGWELVAKSSDLRPPVNREAVFRDKDGLPILIARPPAPQAAPDVHVGVTLGLITETKGYKLDELAHRMETSRIGDDSDEELQEQLLRQLYGRGPEQALEFLKALTRAFRRENYPDRDRDVKAGKVVSLKGVDIGRIPKSVDVRIPV
jgi:hypothetical protein